MGYRLVQAVFVVGVGRLGDMFGRVRIYNAGFAVFTVASILLSFDPFLGGAGAMVADRLAVRPGHGRVDADGQLGRHPDRRLPGQPARLRARDQSGGGALRAVHRSGARGVCWPSGTGAPCSGSTCRWGSSAPGGPTPGYARWGHAPAAGWTGGATSPSPWAWAPCSSPSRSGSSRTTGRPWAGRAPRCWALALGGWPCWRRSWRSRERVEWPMFDLRLFRIRAFTAGNVASFAARLGQGGLQFMLVIWLQGIWLPLHGYDFYIDATVGRHLPAAAHCWVLRIGTAVGLPVGSLRAARLATAGMVRLRHQLPLAAVRCRWTSAIREFAAITLLNGVGIGMFSAPNTSSMMSRCRPSSAARSRACARRSRTPALRSPSACSSR